MPSTHLYHIHPITGTPATCRASQGKCPFGASQEHYSNREEAREAFEAQMQHELFSTHHHDPEVETLVRELFSHHITKSQDPDVQTLLRRTVDELATSASVIHLNRSAALYLHAAGELDDDENLAEASDMVGVAASYLTNYYRYNHRPSVRIPEAFAEVKELLLELHQRNLNERLLASDETGVVEAGGYNALLVRNEDPLSAPLGERLRTTPADAIYLGKTSREIAPEVRAEIEGYAQELIAGFSTEGRYEPPQEGRRDKRSLPEGFSYLSAGAESNVYLHEATDTVFKLPHNRSIAVFIAGGGDKTSVPELNVVVFKAQEAYERVDRSYLEKGFQTEYLNTYFASLKDGEGNAVGVIVQPYLSEERYIEYRPTTEEKRKLDIAGVRDIHMGNVRLDTRTKKLVLFDCLFLL
jgi:hypothetical protein